MSWQQTGYQRHLCAEVAPWGVEHDYFPLFPGMEFPISPSLVAKRIIDQTKILKIISKAAPLIHESEDAQGALLHAHVDATVDKGYLLELALKAPFFHVRTSCAATTAISTAAVPEFRAFKEAQLSQSASVTDPEYPANSWIPLHQVRESFSLGGPDGFDIWVLDTMTINPYMFDADVNETVPQSQMAVGFWMVCTTLRILFPEEIEWYLEDCITLKQEFPNLIAEFDIVGDENDAGPLIDYIKPLLAFKRRVKDLRMDLPLFLHAGKTLSDGGKADNNLYDALLLGTKRIGHGFSINGIVLEVCPISCGLTSSMPMHPLPAKINQGVPVTLNSDDRLCLERKGSYDFYQVFFSSETTGLITLKKIALDSIETRAASMCEKRWYGK
ncbi:hypothetical protein EDB86DRAFT_3062117 [Lactarius hatsudake]|nr:hypothetical protein EDB86DRAFT_3062117 [Lactarius hatsudake]